jgi:predicted DNA-binding transcriptional regulator AlpA
VAKKTHPSKSSAPRTRKPTDAQLLLKGMQVEQVYGVPYRTLYDLHLRGALPAIRLNRSIWFRRADIEALLEKSVEVCT